MGRRRGRRRVPAPLTSFVGREREVAAVRERLRDPAVRLLTLTGPGGVGKTRLALEAAADLVGGQPGRRLAGRPWAAGRPRPGAAGGRRDARRAPGVGDRPAAALLAAVRRRRLLLVLDNCEHLLGACAPLVEALLRGAPGVRVLATSREPLGVAGEAVWRVPPLETPAAGEASAAALAGNEAVRLFVERARAARPGFALRPRTPGPWPTSAAGWTASRWRSSWRPPACASSRSGTSSSAWTTASGCSPAGAGRRCPASRRWPRPSTGATTS